ncbi:RING/U-box superfamily protein [Striga asiatica]|uniref:RING/U-box superfamily protein n=1 Tax=Striga asiatica TaxID=4170 RepID=A0A5A7NVP5_STRAF|nr:RING/U-box superfamily protein [Striga asiatica]
MGRIIHSFNILPDNIHLHGEENNREITAETNITVSEEDLNTIKSLNQEQKKKTFDIILERVYRSFFFYRWPRWNWQNFLYKAILADIRSKGYIALATAISGIASVDHDILISSVVYSNFITCYKYQLFNIFCSFSKMTILDAWKKLTTASSLFSRFFHPPPSRGIAMVSPTALKTETLVRPYPPVPLYFVVQSVYSAARRAVTDEKGYVCWNRTDFSKMGIHGIWVKEVDSSKLLRLIITNREVRKAFKSTRFHR